MLPVIKTDIKIFLKWITKNNQKKTNPDFAVGVVFLSKKGFFRQKVIFSCDNVILFYDKTRKMLDFFFEFYYNIVDIILL